MSKNDILYYYKYHTISKVRYATGDETRLLLSTFVK